MFVWVFRLHSKAETQSHLKNFVSTAERQFDTKIKTIRSDNGLEFIMKQFYDETGIVHQTTCVETPQDNGIVERKHQHLLNVTRSLLFQSNLPSIFWSYVLVHFAVLVNCMPTSFLHNKTPYENLYGTTYDIDSLKVFGCLCFSSTLTRNRKKLDPRVATFYITLDPKTRVVHHQIYNTFTLRAQNFK